ncbi:hypothetical protein JCM21900_005438 [Sporobolomyces salmonicolor]
MLRTVRSRQLWGVLVITVLPASAYLGYYLRDTRDAQIAATVATPDVDERILKDKISMLRKRDVLLAEEERDLSEKLARLRAARERVGKAV